MRLRVCGICIQNERILLINHSLYGKDTFFWSPPGGGVQFGETATEALEREFLEETGLRVKVGKLLFINEHIEAPLHAVEMFFQIDSFEGTLKTGEDPELSAEGQVIEQVQFLSWDELTQFAPNQLHRIFSMIGSLDGVFHLQNYIPGQNSGLEK
ncbi:NUDIX hydrolase [Dyadobacter luticola]|uniref:NUDIX hydrolase n=1 Tax=Dyadobacter luticola TaxID=1979387 RepID=A0A5R9L665_9BACT|nr:NUDIX hydrolase [Dyadobacter luticola]